MKRNVGRLRRLAWRWSSAARRLAHHSQVAVYQSNTEQKIEGKLVQVLIRSPHSWVHVEAKDEKGRCSATRVEWGGAAQLRNAGVDGKTLKVGDKVKVTGRPGRNPPITAC